MEGWRFERELEAISVADLQEAEKAFTSIVNMLNSVDAAISGGKWTTPGELESLLQQRQAATQARGVALSRVE